MIIGIRAFQDKGKTALAVGIAKELVFHHGYSFSEVIANLHLSRWPGSHCLSNKQMQVFIQRMVTRGLRHKIVILDEADRLFPARFWNKAEQSEALIGLWQDYKLFNCIIYTAHEGTSVDVILRSVTQIELVPEYSEKDNCIYFTVYNAVDGIVYDDCLLNPKEMVFPDYDRWEIIGQMAGPGPESPNLTFGPDNDKYGPLSNLSGTIIGAGRADPPGKKVDNRTNIFRAERTPGEVAVSGEQPGVRGFLGQESPNSQ